ncbi:MAG: glycoside hydrolase family 99-like domain-containing protein [Anaerolineales bacterium]|nr:MAG: glycoside hydrolase family 99-like domain-containing protein [Anaerolineales bacterium]
MEKSIQSVFLAFVLLTVLLSGCAPASTPIPPAPTSPIAPTIQPTIETPISTPTIFNETVTPSFFIQQPYPTRTKFTPAEIYKPEKLVWAIYYGWYMDMFYPRTWSSDIWTDRPLIPYESDDPDGIRQHILWAKSAGIDGFLYEWCGDGLAGDDARTMDSVFELVLDIAYHMDFKIAVYYDQLCMNPFETKQVQSQMEYLLRYRAVHPAYYWTNGKPVVVIYYTTDLELSEWKIIFDNLETDGLQAIYIGESYDPNELNVFNGLHQYINLPMKDLPQTYSDLSRQVQALNRQKPGREHLWIATVSPGFDNTPLVNRSDAEEGSIPTIIDRLNGQTYSTSWDKALNSGADWIIITSWNEWQENTHIEPSQIYGDTYLRITKQYTMQWKRP